MWSLSSSWHFFIPFFSCFLPIPPPTFAFCFVIFILAPRCWCFSKWQCNEITLFVKFLMRLSKQSRWHLDNCLPASPLFSESLIQLYDTLRTKNSVLEYRFIGRKSFDWRRANVSVICHWLGVTEWRKKRRKISQIERQAYQILLGCVARPQLPLVFGLFAAVINQNAGNNMSNFVFSRRCTAVETWPVSSSSRGTQSLPGELLARARCKLNYVDLWTRPVERNKKSHSQQIRREKLNTNERVGCDDKMQIKREKSMLRLQFLGKYSAQASFKVKRKWVCLPFGKRAEDIVAGVMRNEILSK